ncbi:hypothetical protein F5H01DRAFT_336146 [Linnemannia elongata]|nr:hypothetical protein F5H01DRAFT_336146 [Linnemannia elongata]
MVEKVLLVFSFSQALHSSYAITRINILHGTKAIVPATDSKPKIKYTSTADRITAGTSKRKSRDNKAGRVTNTIFLIRQRVLLQPISHPQTQTMKA